MPSYMSVFRKNTKHRVDDWQEIVTPVALKSSAATHPSTQIDDVDRIALLASVGVPDDSFSLPLR